MNRDEQDMPSRSLLNRLVDQALGNRLIVLLIVALVVFWGFRTAPFEWTLGNLPRDPVPVDAIPDIGENQQIVFTEWMGRSPQDVEDQLTYPLTVSMLGIPSIKSIRSFSMFGFSTIYVIFKDEVDFYWARTRVLEKLNSLPVGTLPADVQPTLGPDATALGQIFWYTLEGQDQHGDPTGGWSLEKLRSIQDWYIRYALMTAEGVSEVASVGGFVKEYQVDVDPDILQGYDIALGDVFKAVQKSNLDVGARTIDINNVEYVIRGLGFIKSISDIEETVVKVVDHVPIRIKDIAQVSLGPALRRGALDKQGAEAVGGVVVARFGENPLATLHAVHDKIEELSPGLPEKVIIDYTQTDLPTVRAFAQQQKFAAFNDAGTIHQEAWLEWFRKTDRQQQPAWLTYSKIHIVPFYDRSGLIRETLDTLNTALIQQVLVTVIVIMIMVRVLGVSVMISALMPLSILMTFIAMKWFNVDANVVALAGIAIAIGTMVDMGIVISENILRHMRKAHGDQSVRTIVYNATSEVASAVITAVATTVVGFMPVFALQAAEGKLFKPLAYTKTFALIASAIVAITVLPVIATFLMKPRFSNDWKKRKKSFQWLEKWRKKFPMVGKLLQWVLIGFVIIILALHWLPLGPECGSVLNVIFVTLLITILLSIFYFFYRIYARLLGWFLEHKIVFLFIPVSVTTLGVVIWLGWGTVFGWLPGPLRTWSPIVKLAHVFPGLEKEFMPHLDEGSFLTMPTTMPHASIGEALDSMQKLDAAIAALPETTEVVGKLGRVDSSLDPAPISMFEVVINYHSPYLLNEKGKRLRFKVERNQIDLFRNQAGQPMFAPDGEPYVVQGRFIRDKKGALIPDRKGKPFGLWRPALHPDLNPGREAWSGIQSPDDIWNEIVRVSRIPGLTSSPKLQPIETRIIMLQSGMRAPMGIKVRGPDLETIEQVSLDLERILKQIPSVRTETVFADRMVGKPYLEIDIDRISIGRYGLQIQDVQHIIETAIGGKPVTMTVEGRERYPVRIRYPRELRSDLESIERILIPTRTGGSVPLGQLAEIRYERGPQVIKSEDTFLVGYVTFDKQPGSGEVDVVEQCKAVLAERIATGALVIPAGVSYTFAGTYENQVRAARTLSVVIPVALAIIFLILYVQFHSIRLTLLVFTGIFVAWSGGFIMIWLYTQGWFMNFTIFSINMRDLFQIHPYHLSVAVWVGFLALFGIATDDGVLMGTILSQRFKKDTPLTQKEIRKATVEAASLRIRPALMTSATTILALLPILTSTGRGAGIMIPMAIPTFGGMLIALLTVFVVPVIFCLIQEKSQKS